MKHKRSITISLVAIIGLLFLAITSVRVGADGSETIGTPSIPIAQGSGIVAAGTGTAAGSGTILLSVPSGVTIKQVLLYWEGYDNAADGVDNDDETIIIDNTGDALPPAAVTGVKIGSTLCCTAPGFDGTEIAYRQDITSLNLVSPGPNTLQVSGLTFLENNGAGVLVIYDDGSTSSDIQIRDGADFAFAPPPQPNPDWPPPLDTTVKQVFNFTPTSTSRTANLNLFVASVAGSHSGQTRPNVIEVTVSDGSSSILTKFVNELDGKDGPEWDTFRASIIIPPGYNRLEVQAFSRNDTPELTSNHPASLVWVTAGLSVPKPCSGKIGDFVWKDIDGDGIQDANEPGIKDVVLELRNSSNQLIATTTSDANGQYEFKDLCAGTYTVTVIAPQGDVLTTAGAGGDTAKDSNFNPATVILAANNSTDSTIDFGFKGPGVIGDFVFKDQNCDGLQDAGDQPFSSITVRLKTDTGTLLATTTTDANGKYQFLNLNPGTYKVEVDTPPGFTPKAGTQSKTSPATVVLTQQNPVDNTVDFGFCPSCSGSIGDFVWNDLDKDGVQDANEPGINGVTVKLFSGATQLASTTTSGNGFYQFNNLCAGTYRVEVTTPAGFTPTLENVGNDATDNDGSPEDVTLPFNNSSNQTIDFGFFVTEQCGPCAGKVTTLTLKYIGSIVNAHIEVFQKNGVKVFDGIVQPGGTFSFVGADKMGTLGTDIFIDVNGVRNTSIHTSCSQPIGPGLVRGDFEVVSGRSKEGGLLCPLSSGGGGDFTVSATPTSRTINKGQSTTYTVTVTPSGGFTGSVALSVSGLQSKASGSFNPSSVNITDASSKSSTLTITTGNRTATGTNTLTITGTGGGKTRTTTVSLTIN